MRTGILGLLVLLVLAGPCLGQPRVSPRNVHERLLCVVPMVGAGTPEDPRRPMFAPLPPGPGELPSRSGILAFTYQESDNGRFALVEFVAANRTAFATILSENRPDVKAFIRGVARRTERALPGLLPGLADHDRHDQVVSERHTDGDPAGPHL